MRSLEESLFWEIFYRREVVRGDLARLFDVSAATISRSANVLLSKSLVIETGAATPNRGRRPALLQLNPQLAYVAGLELDRDRITAVITDLQGNLIGRGALSHNAGDSVANTLKACGKALQIALADGDMEETQVARIGIGHTGTLDVQNGICLDWERVPHWRGVRLREELRETFRTEITLDDRARAVALAVHLLVPENRHHRCAVYVQIGTGIGAGIFVDGRMLRGATLAGGELGHMVIDRNGPACRCGKKGCVEAYASMPATISRVTKAIEGGAASMLAERTNAGDEITAEEIVAAARRGDRLAQSALHETAQALAIAIANVAQLLNPSLIVLAGKFANAARDNFIETVSQAVRAQCFETISRGLEIRAAPIRKDLEPVGCALLAAIDVAAELLQRLIFPPLVVAAGHAGGDERIKTSA